MPRGRPRKVEQGNAAELPQEAPPAAPPTAPEAPQSPAQSLDAFMAWAENAKAADGVVLVSLTHPDAKEERIVPGRFSGYRLAPGPIWCQWSDGATHQ